MSFPSTNSLSTLHAYFPESLNPLLHHSTPGISTSLSMNNCFLHASGSLSKGNCSSSSRVLFSSFSSVAQLCTTLCNSMDCSMWGFPVHHQLPELAQTHLQVGDAVQPSHPLSSSSPPPFNLASIKVSSNESVLWIRWSKYWSFSFSPSNEYSGLTGLISLQSKELSRVFSNTMVQKHQFFGAELSLWSNSHIHKWLLEKS